MIGRLLTKFRSSIDAASVRSLQAFVRSHPGYTNLTASCNECREELRHGYESYVKNVSRADMAISLELASLLLALCRINQWKRVLDLGSGFSSYVFRKYAKENPGVVVYSVDDDTKWLDRTRDYLRDQQLPTENLLALDDFLNTNMGGFDCLLMDLNFVEVRIQFIRQALAHLEAGGLAVFDDVHKLDYRRLTIKILSSEVGTTYSLKPVTKDSFGRFAYAFVSGQHGA